MSGFSDEERERIRAELVAAGRELFVALVFTARSRNAPIGAESDESYERVEDALIETIVDGLFADG